MSYTKTQWVNNTTPINDTNLNKMEQGIYDNSLVVDAVTNTINPTDTETYKTAELTEGQITDVIGVSDILIKGQTSQDGEPTPSSPVDVNVVSGSNVVNIREEKINKNNIVHIYSQSNLTSFVSNPRATSTYFECKPNTTYKILRSEIIQRGNFRITSSPALEGIYTNFVNGANVTEVSITSGNQDKYVVIYYHWEGDSEASSDEVLDTLSAYEMPGKELPLALPVKNLFDESLITSTTSSIKYIPIQCQANTDYTLSTNNVASPTNTNLFLSTQDSGVTSANNGAYINSPRTINSGNNTTIYVGYRNDLSNNWIQLEKGSSASPYHPYGTDPIELCKIGNYQDYFYKSGSKWYLHKEIGKITLNGSESGGWTLRETNTNTIRITADGLASLGILAYSQVYSKVFKGYSSNADMSNIDIPSIAPRDTGGGFTVRFPVSIATTVDGFKTWLASNLPFVYYATSKITDTEITDTNLISQLEAIYNAPLYEQTNITQTNNDLPMVLDITACKDNINGIKAFIRK